jgi:predicted ATPase
MIIELQNFGPIKSFKFDTSKDMHAIFGKNNIGKSYAISAVYLILKGLREYEYDDGFSSTIPNNPEIENIVEFVARQFNEFKLEELDITNEINYRFNDSLNLSLMLNLTNSIKNTFDINNIQNVTSKKPLKIVITLGEVIIIIGLDSFSKTLKVNKIILDHKFTVKASSIPQKPTRNDGVYTFFCHDGFDSKYQASGLESILSILHFRIGDEIKKVTQHIYILPASRSGLYNALNSFGAIFAELSRNRSFLTRKIEIPSIAEPISDYFLNLNTIDKAQANEHYLQHFEEIEQEILKGKITLDNDSKKYYYIPNDTDMRLELSFTSSMISEIAPIIAHLKYIIPLESDKPSILFIEEPEAHLHPEIQILLIEYFVKLCKGNVKIVMTSHSNYIFNKLSNLLIAKEIDAEKLSVMLMKMTPEGSVVEDNEMHIDEYGIEDNNFVDVAEQLYEERMALLEKL